MGILLRPNRVKVTDLSVNGRGLIYGSLGTGSNLLDVKIPARLLHTPSDRAAFRAYLNRLCSVKVAFGNSGAVPGTIRSEDFGIIAANASGENGKINARKNDEAKFIVG